MARIRQKLVARDIVEKTKNGEAIVMKEILAKRGYSKSVQKNPEQVLESIGVKQELSNLGFTVEGADGVVENILYNGKSEKTQLTAANLVYERLGAKAPDKSINVNVSVLDDQAISDIADKLNKEMINVYQGTSISGNGEISSVMAKEVRDENGEGSTA
jgi:hypothetical protein